jgi:glycosyltransferase involved in cell wall biosynthesis
VKVLHAYNQHRGGGGANNTVDATLAVSRQGGLEIETFARTSHDVPPGLWGRVHTALSASYRRDAVRAFAALLDRMKPDVVHAHELFPLVSPGILPECTRRDIPVVLSLYDYRLTCPVTTHLRGREICTRCVGGREYSAVLGNCRDSAPESLTMALYSFLTRKLRLMSGHVRHFIAFSEFQRRWMIEHAGIAPERISAVSPVVVGPASGVDAAQGTYVAYSGRFTVAKGIEILIEAQRRSGLPFRAARHVAMLDTATPGDGIETVVTHGRDDLAAFYRGARLLVVPSIWYETFGIVGAEAMGHGIPVLVPRGGALAELVEDGVHGLHFTPADAGDLADKVSQLWADPERCRRMGQAARDRALRLWGTQQHLDALILIYEPLVNRGRLSSDRQLLPL